MATWKVIIDYDARRSIEEQDRIDQEMDRLAQSSGVIVDGGRGSGFDRRDLDYHYDSEEEAEALVQGVTDAFSNRAGLDLSARYIALEGAFEA